MKFHKTLQSIEGTFRDPLLSETCIPYKKWKKVAKKKYIYWDNIQHLESQCLQVDRILRNRIEPIYTPSKSTLPSLQNMYRMICCTPNPVCYKDYTRIDDKYMEDLKKYAEINAEAVYKVCKKMEKSGFEGSMKFLEYLRGTHKYIFLGSGLMTILKLQAENHLQKEVHIDISCIICFENITHTQPAIIFGCGHYHCYECFEKITGIKQVHGTLYNRLAYVGNSHQCPICRYPTGEYRHYKDCYMFWPSLPRFPVSTSSTFA